MLIKQVLIRYITNLLIFFVFIVPGRGQTSIDLTELSLEELMSLEVTTVVKKSVKLLDVPASVFVLSSEDINRSGYRLIPDVMRLSPGMEVSSIDANKWAVSARGFGDRFANKLLVLIDGRSVYISPFSGVYWDVQDYILEDIDRIEIVRGPGASLWGANAVNGVINIISKTIISSLIVILNITLIILIGYNIQLEFLSYSAFNSFIDYYWVFFALYIGFHLGRVAVQFRNIE